MRVAFLTVDAREGSVLAASPQPYLGAAPEALLQGFAELPAGSVEVHVVSCVKTSLPAPRSLAPNVHYHQLVLPSWSFLRMLHAGPILAVRRLLATLKPDIVHAQGVERWCAVSGVFSGIACVLTIHGHLRLILKQVRMKPVLYWWAQMLLGELALKLCSAVVCISRYIKENLGNSVNSGHLIPNAVRLKFFKPLKHTHNAVPTILIIGVICERKRQAEILNMLCHLHDSNLRFRVIVVGTMGTQGAYETKYAEALNQALQRNIVEYFEHLSQDALIELMDHAHALLHFPSEEAFGLVVAESLARGLKLFASQVGGILDIASGVPGAELHDADDWLGLSFAIKRWIEQGAPKNPGAREFVKARFHPKVIAGHHLSLYNYVLSAQTPRG